MKPKDILIVLTTLQTYMVVPPELIVDVNSSHLFVIICYCRGAQIAVCTAIFVLPRNILRQRWVRVGGNDGDWLVILPQRDGEVL